MELLQLHMMGWATAQEVATLIEKHTDKDKKANKPLSPLHWKIRPLNFPRGACTNSFQVLLHLLDTLSLFPKMNIPLPFSSRQHQLCRTQLICDLRFEANKQLMGL